MKWLDEVGVTAPRGFKAAGLNAGIKKKKMDLGLIVADAPCSVAAVYTTNVIQAGSIEVTKTHLRNKMAQVVIINSGNAHVCTATSKSDALRTCHCIAKELEVKVEDVIVASSGVIGQPLQMKKIEKAIPRLVKKLDVGFDADGDIAASIMTTDLNLKQAAFTLDIEGKEVLVAGIAKGSGMAHPNMATMLGFMTTDVAITPELLQKALSEVAALTFNSVSVDGDISTNDMSVIMASGQAGHKLIDSENDSYKIFKNALKEVCLILAKKIAADSEGATKLMICRVDGCETGADAKAISMSVNASSLVKTAVTDADANWGYVLCAMGSAGVDFDPEVVDIMFKSKAGELTVCQDGVGINVDEAKATEILNEKEVTIDIKIKEEGFNASWTTYGCNLTHEYVRINGDDRRS